MFAWRAVNSGTDRECELGHLLAYRLVKPTDMRTFPTFVIRSTVFHFIPSLCCIKYGCLRYIRYRCVGIR